MSTPGYSGTPLIKKLGIKDDWKLRFIQAPEAYFEWLGNDLSSRLCPQNATPDFVHLFAATHRDFEHEMKALSKIWKKNTQVVIWVSWYKKSAGIPTDLCENDIRNYALANGLVDIKVCAVSDQWSGLKLVVPVKNR